MRGKILDVATLTKAGVIAGEDGMRHRYGPSDLRNPPPRVGQTVDFEALNGAAREIYTLPLFDPTALLTQRDWARFYLDPTGRISKRDFWLYGILGIVVSNCVLGWIPFIGLLFTFVTAWAAAAVACKRCHDVDRSGWWVMLPVGPLVIAAIAAADAKSPSGAISTFFGLVWLGVSVWLLVTIFIKPGDPGPNRFGPAPTVDPS